MTSACTWLFVPGDREERFAKAEAARPGEVIIDLEDSVGSGRKAEARRAASDWLGEHGAWVRLNAAGTPDADLDVAALRGRAGLRGVLIPKAESAAALCGVADRVDVPVMALVETAVGVERVHELAGTEPVVRLAFGAIDYALDVGSEESDDALLYARSRIVVGSRVAGLPAPVDGVTVELDDQEATATAAARAKALGFGGKLCIHPRQVATVAAAFRATPEEQAWARRVLDAAESGAATRIDGRMVDRPVVDRARAILFRSTP